MVFHFEFGRNGINKWSCSVFPLRARKGALLEGSQKWASKGSKKVRLRVLRNGFWRVLRRRFGVRRRRFDVLRRCSGVLRTCFVFTFLEGRLVPSKKVLVLVLRRLAWAVC